MVKNSKKGDFAINQMAKFIILLISLIVLIFLIMYFSGGLDTQTDNLEKATDGFFDKI